MATQGIEQLRGLPDHTDREAVFTFLDSVIADVDHSTEEVVSVGFTGLDGEVTWAITTRRSYYAKNFPATSLSVPDGGHQRSTNFGQALEAYEAWRGPMPGWVTAHA